MKIVLSLLALVLLINVNAQKKVKHSFTEEYKVNSNPTLKVFNSDGDIKIASHDKNVIQVYYQVKENGDLVNISKNEVADFFKTYNANVNHTDNQLDLNLTFKGNSKFIDLVILVPIQTTVKVTTGDGDIGIANLSANVKCRTDDGDVNIANIKAEEVKAETADGDMNFANLDAQKVQGNTEDGDLNFANINGSEVDAITGDGDINLKNINADVKAKTGDGDISTKRITGKLNANTGDGEISRG